MRINPIEPSPITYKGYKIDAKQNKQIEFLYNKASDVLKQEQQTIIYKPYEITFSKLTTKMKEMFDSFGIKITETLDK